MRYSIIIILHARSHSYTIFSHAPFNCDLSQIKENPEISDETVIINALIKEYLQFSGYNNTHSVFQMGIL